VKITYLQTVILSNYYSPTSLQYLFIYFWIEITKYVKDIKSLTEAGKIKSEQRFE